MTAGYPKIAWPPYLNITSIPSVKLEVLAAPSRYQAWKSQVSPIMNVTFWGRLRRFGVKLKVPLDPELRIVPVGGLLNL